jgi:UDP-N-acetylmuramyl tripeptide synthase
VEGYKGNEGSAEAATYKRYSLTFCRRATADAAQLEAQAKGEGAGDAGSDKDAGDSDRSGQSGESGVDRLRTDSRLLRPGDAFIAWPGHATDGRRHVSSALAAGAAACLFEAEGADAFEFDANDPRLASLAGLKAATGPLAAAWFGEPARALQVIAVTGTNGKSSTAWWTAQALSALGQRCGLVGTLGIGEPPLQWRCAACA